MGGIGAVGRVWVGGMTTSSLRDSLCGAAVPALPSVVAGLNTMSPLRGSFAGARGTIGSQSFSMSRRAGAPNGRPYIFAGAGFAGGICGRGLRERGVCGVDCGEVRDGFARGDVGAAVRAARPRPPIIRGGFCRREGYDWFPIVFDVAEGGRPERAPLHFAVSGRREADASAYVRTGQRLFVGGGFTRSLRLLLGD